MPAFLLQLGPFWHIRPPLPHLTERTHPTEPTTPTNHPHQTAPTEAKAALNHTERHTGPMTTHPPLLPLETQALEKPAKQSNAAPETSGQDSTSNTSAHPDARRSRAMSPTRNAAQTPRRSTMSPLSPCLGACLPPRPSSQRNYARPSPRHETTESQGPARPCAKEKGENRIQRFNSPL